MLLIKCINKSLKLDSLIFLFEQQLSIF